MGQYPFTNLIVIPLCYYGTKRLTVRLGSQKILFKSRSHGKEKENRCDYMGQVNLLLGK